MDNQMIDPKYLAMIQAGLGILAGNNGKQPVGATIGQGLLGGTQGYQQNLQQQQDYALKKQMADYQGQEISWKQKEHQQKLDAAKKQEEMNNNILASLGIGIPASSSTQVDYTPTNFNVLERQSGDIPAQQKPKAMDRDALYKLGLATSLTGGHGGDALIKYADSQKPNWQNVGGKLVDANQYQGEIPIAPTPMTEQQKMQGAHEGWYKPEQETTSPKVVNNGTQKSYLSNPNLSPKAKEALSIKDAEKEIDRTYSKSKPLPATVLKMQNEALDKLSVASNIDKDLAIVEQQIIDGKLNLGFFGNIASDLKNKAGYSDENSRNYATFKNTLEKLRNDSLRLNTGVQTDGDAQRAWNELFANINDNEFVKKRLGEIRTINQRGADLQKLQVDQIRTNFDVEPLDFSKYEGQSAAIKGDGAIIPKNEKMPTKDISKLPKSKIVKMNGKNVSLLLDEEGDYYNPSTGKKVFNK